MPEHRKIAILEERAVFAVKLARLITQGRDIIYMDETTFNNYMRPRKTYMYPECPVTSEISLTRIGGVTLYGAIGNCL